MIITCYNEKFSDISGYPLLKRDMNKSYILHFLYYKKELPHTYRYRSIRVKLTIFLDSSYMNIFHMLWRELVYSDWEVYVISDRLRTFLEEKNFSIEIRLKKNYKYRTKDNWNFLGLLSQIINIFLNCRVSYHYAIATLTFKI